MDRSLMATKNSNTLQYSQMPDWWRSRGALWTTWFVSLNHLTVEDMHWLTQANAGQQAFLKHELKGQVVLTICFVLSLHWVCYMHVKKYSMQPHLTNPTMHTIDGFTATFKMYHSWFDLTPGHAACEVIMVWKVQIFLASSCMQLFLYSVFHHRVCLLHWNFLNKK